MLLRIYFIPQEFFVYDYVLLYFDEQIKAASHNKSHRAINNAQQTNCYYLVHYRYIGSYW